VITKTKKGIAPLVKSLFWTDKLTQIKRVASLLLLLSFYLPLYSCQSKPPSTAKTIQSEQKVSVKTPYPTPDTTSFSAHHKIPSYIEFSAYESLRWPSVESALTIIAFTWAVCFQLLLTFFQTLKNYRSIAILELLLCCGSASGITWYLWHGLHIPGTAIEYGTYIAYSALTAYFAATIFLLLKPKSVP
jgi:hypothetical protein